MSTTMTMHQSKWGYHPCSRETFQKLKLIHKRYLEAMRRAAAWERWNRKLPSNRVSKKTGQPIQEPETFSEVKEGSGHWTAQGYNNQVVKFNYLDPSAKEWADSYRSWLADYRNARTPKASPEEVVPLKHSEAKIEQTYSIWK